MCCTTVIASLKTIETLPPSPIFLRRLMTIRYIRDSADLRRQMAGGLDVSLRDDFTWSLRFSPGFYADLAFEGFLSIASELSEDGLLVLMPKLHEKRCSTALVFWSSNDRAKRVVTPLKHRYLNRVAVCGTFSRAICAVILRKK